jgi:SH3 domain-containing YSC84-like protein 1
MFNCTGGNVTARILLAAIAAATVLFAQSDVQRRLDNAASVMSEIMDVRDKAIPQDLLDKAECAIVVPGMKKGAFIVGAKYGRGFLSCRAEGGQGWSAPAAIRIEGGSVGFQIGGSETDVILLVMNSRGMQRLLSNQFKLGADASVAAGPVGRSTTAETDVYLTAEMLSWSRSRGVFAGISLQGSTVRQDRDVNRELYGRAITNKEIVEQRPPVPAGAQAFISTLNKYSARKSS